jgi:3-hydroxy-D-aspartate aldolase
LNDRDLHSHLIGVLGSRRQLNTPVLVVELDRLQRNIETMAAFAAAHGVKLRPHAKTHKSPEIARRQVDAGAVGASCAKLGEAEALADGGIDGLLITSPVVSESAIRRLIALNERCLGVKCVVDHADNVRALGSASSGRKPLDVLIDIDPGIHRTGVASAEDALSLYHAIRRERGLGFAGVQFYCGAEQHIERFSDRKAAIEARSVVLRKVIGVLGDAGAPPPLVTGGGTGTHRIDVDLKIFTELQVGSYVFMDTQYGACDLTGTGQIPFETALMIDTRVISTNAAGMVTLDGGLKAFSTDAGPPVPIAGAPAGATYRFMGDEHGALISPQASQLKLADIVTLSAPHCDPTVNLYDTYHVVRGDTLCALWPVAARGRSR